MNKPTFRFLLIASVCAASVLTACDDGKSYSELLSDENATVNRYLVNQRVIGAVPPDSVFITGPDAPYYQLDDEGNVYMQVLDAGSDERPATGARVYFRFMRYNLNTYVEGEQMTGTGNADNMNPSSGSPVFFNYNDYTSTSSQAYGSGIQMPLHFLGYNCHVNIIIKSQYGWTDETASVVPFLYDITYYKPQI